MCDLNLVDVNRVLVKGVSIIVSVRMLAKNINKDIAELAELEREFREAAADVQRAIRSIDGGR